MSMLFYIVSHDLIFYIHLYFMWVFCSRDKGPGLNLKVGRIMEVGTEQARTHKHDSKQFGSEQSPVSLIHKQAEVKTRQVHKVGKLNQVRGRCRIKVREIRRGLRQAGSGKWETSAGMLSSVQDKLAKD